MPGGPRGPGHAAVHPDVQRLPVGLVFIVAGDKPPATSALNNPRGRFFTDRNLPAAGSVVVALPTVPVFMLLQRQFVAGPTLGADKG